MLVSLEVGNHKKLRSLYDNYPYLRGEVAGIIYGGMDEVFVTNPTEPEAALAVLDFRYLAGDPGSEATIELIQFLKPGIFVVVPSAEWHSLLVSHYSGELKTYPREAFQAGDFDIEHLKYFCEGLPQGFTLKRVEPNEVAQFSTDLHPVLVYNWASHTEFSLKGFGFGVVHQGRFVCGVSSCALGGGKVEFEVQTHQDYRQRGLATAGSAAMILYCLEHELEPCWDAANPLSAGLARKLGFQSTGKYDAYVLA